MRTYNDSIICQSSHSFIHSLNHSIGTSDPKNRMSFVFLFNLLFLPFILAESPVSDIELGTNPCVDWEVNIAAYKEAFAKWQEPPCYNFTYTDLGSSSDLTPVVRTVRNGSSLQDGDSRPFQTLAEVWNKINDECFRDCPNSGAYYCEIEYTTSNENGFMYPASFKIDYEEMIEADEATFRIEAAGAIDCAALDGIESVILKPNMCEEYLMMKHNIEKARLDWENVGDCYNYTIERNSEEHGGPFHITVRDGIPNIVGETTQTEMNRTLSDWMDEIQDKTVDRCHVDHEKDPFDYSSLAFDPFWGYPSYVYLESSFINTDEGLSFVVTDFSRCSGRKAGVCDDYDRVKSNYTDAIASWYWFDECYAYTIQQNSRSVDELHGPFQVLIQDRIPRVIDALNTMNELNEPDFAVTVEDWMKRIKEHCILACESDSSMEAYYNCSVEYDSTNGLPTSILFDMDESITGDELEYKLSAFMPCSNFQREENEYNAARARLETLLTEQPCYNFTYTVHSYIAPSPETVSVMVLGEVGDGETAQSTDRFSSLLDVMSLYRKACFPIVTTDIYFQCTISYDDLGIPIMFEAYNSAAANNLASVVVDDVTFSSCDKETSSAVISVSAMGTSVHLGILAFLL